MLYLCYMEIWKKIPNFSRYEASNLGRLKTFGWKGSKLEKVLAPAKTPDGYMKTVLIRDDGKKCSWCVHKFVMLAFIGERQEGYEINHINGIKDDNRIENLEYCTRHENLIHAYRMNLKVGMKGESNPLAKLTDVQVREIREYVANCKKRYYGRKELALKYGVSECTIKEVVTFRKNKFAHVTLGEN